MVYWYRIWIFAWDFSTSRAMMVFLMLISSNTCIMHSRTSSSWLMASSAKLKFKNIIFHRLAALPVARSTPQFRIRHRGSRVSKFDHVNLATGGISSRRPEFRVRLSETLSPCGLPSPNGQFKQGWVQCFELFI